MRFLPGHWALGLWKIRASAAPFLRLSLPNQRPDSVSAVGTAHWAARPQPSPYKGEGGWPKARRMRVGPETAENPQQTANVSSPYRKAGVFPRIS